MKKQKNIKSFLFHFSQIYFASLAAICSISVTADELDTLMAMSLEDLSATNITVTSAAKKAQSLSTVPGSVYVITNAQIRRSGARSIAEALALAPGIQVTKISEFNWQVSLRGLNEILFNKLLVMVDGRTVFSPLMSGTFWDTVDTVMEDIERIEIIRGTAGTMWGGNAANGVVNIITKHSQDTQGSYLEINAGEHQYQEVNYRHGMTLSEATTARVFVKGVKSDYYVINDDQWKSYQAGIRADYLDSNTQMSITAGGYHNRSTHNWLTVGYNQELNAFQLSPDKFNDYSRGGYISFDWAKQQQQTDYELSLWADANSSVEPSSSGEFYSLDIESLIRTPINPVHEMTAGGGIRVIHRHTASYPRAGKGELPVWGRVSRDPNNTDSIYNAYLQLESSLTNDITTTLGTKVEHFTQNNSTEFQPQARILYEYSQTQQFWAGIGRAVVTPSIVDSETDHYFFRSTEQPIQNGAVGQFPLLTFSFGNKNMKNESVITLDMGHRYSPFASLHIDSTIFYSKYKNLRMKTDSSLFCAYGSCLDGSQVPSYLFVQSSKYTDQLNANSYGFETAIHWAPLNNFRINTSYSYISTEAKCQGFASCESDATGGYRLKYNLQPNHLVSINTQWDISPAWQLDFWLKHKSAVSSDITYSDGSQPFRAPSVSTLDMRLGWQEKPTWPRLELIVDALGKESYEDQPGKAPIEETAYLRASWDFL